MPLDGLEAELVEVVRGFDIESPKSFPGGNVIWLAIVVSEGADPVADEVAVDEGVGETTAGVAIAGVDGVAAGGAEARAGGVVSFGGRSFHLWV